MRVRISLTLFLSLLVTSVVVALPVVTPVWAQAAPVKPGVHRVALTGVDPAALAAAPAALDPAAVQKADTAAAAGPTGLAAAPTARVSGRRPVLFTRGITTATFTAAGVSWAAAGAPSGVVVQVRVLTDGSWGDWTPLAVADGPDVGTPEGRKASARVSTEPISTVGGSGVQVRLDSAAGRAPRDVTLLTVDPGTSAADANLSGAPAASAGAAAVSSQPAIITRAQWGADESMRDCTPTYMRTVRVAFVHHTVGTNSYEPSQSASLVRGIYAYHVQGNGWCDIGYNFLVDRYGQVFEGRYGGIDRPVLGAHTLAFNWESFSVSAMGDFSASATPAPMLGSIASVIGWKLGLYGRNPGGRATLTSSGGTGARWPAGTRITFDVVSGHRDAWYTECPGNVLYSQLAGLRSQAYQDLMTRTHQVDSYYAIWGTTSWPPSGRLELHVQGADSAYSRRVSDLVAQWSTGAPGQWRFFIGSSTGDTRPDLIGVHINGTSSGRVEVFETSWASGYQDTDVVTTTPLAALPADGSAQVTVGGPGGGDLYVTLPSSATGRVEVHALSAASNWTQFSLHSTTVLSAGAAQPTTRFLVSDVGDLYVVLHGTTGSHRSELHALTRASGFTSYSRHAVLPVGPVSDTAAQWTLAAGASPDLLLSRLQGTASGQVEIQRLAAAASYGSGTVTRTDLPLLAFPATQVAVG